MAVKRYDGSAWQVVAGKGDQGTSSSIATWVKTASGGETSLSGNDDNSQPLSYTVGQELVFINGALQKRGVDYTATTGTSITGLTALVANDVVTVWTVNAFSVTGAIANTLVDAKGDLIVATGADTPGILSVGSNDQVLTADSSTGTGLKWAAPSAGSWTSIASGNLSGTTLTISSIPGTYKNLRLLLLNPSRSSRNPILIRYNGDSSGIYASGGSRMSEAGTYTNAGSGAGASGIYAGPNNYTTSTTFNGYYQHDIAEYSKTTNKKVGTACYLVQDTASPSLWFLGENYHLWESTSAITSIDIFCFGSGSPTFSSGTYELLGQK